MKDLMVDVLPGGVPFRLADTCRISAGPPGHPECKGRSVAEPPKTGPGQDPPPLCAGTKAPSAGCDRKSGTRGADGLDFLRRELRAQLAGRL